MSSTIMDTVQGYDVQTNGLIRVSSLLKMFQRAAEQDLISFNMPHERMLAHGMAFVISSMNIRFLRDIRVADHVSVTSYPRRVKGVCFIRDYIVSVDGVRCVEASSAWPLIDIAARRVIRPSALSVIGTIDPDDSDLFDIPDIRFRPDDYVLESADVRKMYPSMLDRNCHVNNTFYPDFIYDYLPAAFLGALAGTQLMLRFQHEIVAGDAVEIFTGGTDWRRVTVGKSCNDGTTLFSAVVDKL